MKLTVDDFEHQTLAGCTFGEKDQKVEQGSMTNENGLPLDGLISTESVEYDDPATKFMADTIRLFSGRGEAVDFSMPEKVVPVQKKKPGVAESTVKR
jgi:hypothetical protein